MALLAAAGAALTACAGILGIEELRDRDDAGSDPPADAHVALDAGDAGGVSCPGNDDPEPPPVSTVQPIEILQFGLRSLSVQPGRGRNLDGLCTASGQSPSCSTLDPEGEIYWRDIDGVDRAGEELAKTIGAYFPSMNDEKLTHGIERGFYNWLLELVSWNGLADDDDVTMKSFVSRGLATRSSEEGVDGGDGGRTDGNDGTIDIHRSADFDDPGERWVPLPDSVSHARGIARGYVRDHRLIVKFEDVVGLGVTSSDPDKPNRPPAEARLLFFRLHDAVLTARIVTDEAGPRLEDGLLSGKMSMDEFLAEAYRVTDDSGGAACLNELPDLTQAIGVFCRGRDLNLAGDVAQPCDAFSLNFGLTSGRVKIGETDRGSYTADPCDGGPPSCDNPNGERD